MHKEKRPRFLLLSTKEQITFLRRLSVYLQAGVPILEALVLLSEDARTKSSKHLFESFTYAVREGNTLSTALGKFPRLIPVLVRSLVEVGERSGTLRETLTYLALTLRKQQDLKRKLISSLTYPAIIVCVTIGISVFLILYAFPKIVPLFRGFGSQLPLSTRILIFLGDAGSQYGYLLLLGILLFGISFYFLIRIPRVRLAFDTALLRTPFLGALAREYQLATISYTLSILLKSGIGIVSALELTARTCSNTSYALQLQHAATKVLAGASTKESLVDREIWFPRSYVQIIATGERTGSLPSSFQGLAIEHEEEFDESSTRFTALIEPVLMIVMGFIVGCIALAIITPVYQITQDLHG